MRVTELNQEGRMLYVVNVKPDVLMMYGFWSKRCIPIAQLHGIEMALFLSGIYMCMYVCTSHCCLLSLITSTHAAIVYMSE